VTRAPLTVGVDGATRSLARLRDADGKLLMEASGAAANIHVDFVAAIAALSAVVDEVLRKAALNDADPAQIGLRLGLAGFKEGRDAARVAAAFPGFRLWPGFIDWQINAAAACCSACSRAR
jgi:N-acetylglucosamine kinase-like BadF-type ATPase